MSNLYFSVWTDAKETAKGAVIQEGAIAIGSSSTQGAVIAGTDRAVRRVRVFCEAAAFVTWALDPTAVNDGSEGRAMGAENPEYFDIEAGMKIAVIERV